MGRSCRLARSWSVAGLSRSRRKQKTVPRRDDQNFRSVATGAIYPRAGRSFLDMLNAPADDGENDDAVDRDDDDDELEKRADHAASTVADLLVEAGSFPHR